MALRDGAEGPEVLARIRYMLVLDDIAPAPIVAYTGNRSDDFVAL